jgi:cellulose synthase/poly-beta-1,6-N-acetylglucosamine synthase-like glycosyltransferase
MINIVLYPINYISVFTIGFIYIFIGYSFVLYTASLNKRKERKHDTCNRICPEVTVIASVYNEKDIIEKKLDNLFDMAYPADRIKYVIVDGDSPDGTGKIAREWIRRNGAENFRVLTQKDNKGKIDALNIGLNNAGSDLVMITDADTELLPVVLKSMVPYFADPCVGAVGPWILPEYHKGAVQDMEMSFWLTNNRVRTLESRLSSSSLIAGCYVFRRSLQRQYPADVIADDFYTALNISSKGYDVIYIPQVMGCEMRTPSDLKTWIRHKLRKGIANLQTIAMFIGKFKAGNSRSYIYYNKVAQYIVVPAAFIGFLSLHVYFAFYTAALFSGFFAIYDSTSLYSWYLYVTNLPYIVYAIVAADISVAAGAAYANRASKSRIPRGNVESRQSRISLVIAAAVISQIVMFVAIFGYIFTRPTSKYKRIN